MTSQKYKVVPVKTIVFGGFANTDPVVRTTQTEAIYQTPFTAPRPDDYQDVEVVYTFWEDYARVDPDFGDVTEKDWDVKLIPREMWEDPEIENVLVGSQRGAEDRIEHAHISLDDDPSQFKTIQTNRGNDLNIIRVAYVSYEVQIPILTPGEGTPSVSFETMDLELVGSYQLPNTAGQSWLQTGITVPPEPKKVVWLNMGSLSSLDAMPTTLEGWEDGSLMPIPLSEMRLKNPITDSQIANNVFPENDTQFVGIYYWGLDPVYVARDDDDQLLFAFNSRRPQGDNFFSGANPLKVFTTKTITLAGNFIIDFSAQYEDGDITFTEHLADGSTRTRVLHFDGGASVAHLSTLNKVRVLAGDIGPDIIIPNDDASFIMNRHVDANGNINMEAAAREYALVAASFQPDIAPERSDAFRRRAADLSRSGRKLFR